MVSNTHCPEGYESNSIPVKLERKEDFSARKHPPAFIAKIALDSAMFILLLLLYQKRTVSMSFHEVTGLVLFGLFFIHNLLNWNWIKAVTVKLLS